MAGCACGRQLWALLLVSSLLPVLRLAGLAALHTSEVKQTWDEWDAAVFNLLYVTLASPQCLLCPTANHQRAICLLP